MECGWSTGADIRAQRQRQQLHHEPKRVAGPDDSTAQRNDAPTAKDSEPQPAAAVLHNATERPENDRPAAGTGALVSIVAKLDAITQVTN